VTLTKEEKQAHVSKFGKHGTDTGSPEVQIAMLKLVGRRRRFLNYLQRKDLEGYRALIKELGLRR